jgi:4'-phosphopantetheinyl transferase
MATMMSERNEAPLGVLPEDEAHVWTIASSDALAADVRVLACLSAAEQDRLERHSCAAAAQRFALARLVLRHVLARYTGAAPERVELVVNPGGKPTLADNQGIHFSLTHADRLVLVAVARCDVGIDVERVREPRRLLRTACRVLHPETVATLQSLPPQLRRLAFLDAWTQRESHVKAVGGGIFATADALPFSAGQPADGVPYPCRDRRGTEEWSVARFHPAVDARATLAARGRLTELRFFAWSVDTARAREGQ